MGKFTPVAAPPPQRYRDDFDAVSMHTTPDDYEYDDVPELPSYSDSEAAAAESAFRTAEHTSATIPDASPRPHIYSSIASVTRGDTTTVMDARLSDPDELHRYITSYVTMTPPNQVVKIHGWHSSTTYRNNKKETERVVDFDIKFSMQEYLPTGGVLQNGWRPELAANRDRVYRGNWKKTLAGGHEENVERYEYERDLKEWCEHFCASKARLRAFRIKQDVTGLDYDYLRKNLETLIRSTNYKGHLHITFPIEGRYVDIYNPHPINEWRTNWVRYLFYISMLWIITWPILIFATKWWTVYSVDWHFSWVEQTKKKYAVTTEPGWYNKHADLIRRLAMSNFQGDATGLPLEARTEARSRSTGNAYIDNAVSLIQGGVQVWNTLQRGAGRDVDAWGMDS